LFHPVVFEDLSGKKERYLFLVKIFPMLPIDLSSRLFIEHIVLTVKDMARTKAFYTKIFGESRYQGDDFVMFEIGQTHLFLVIPYGQPLPDDVFNPNRIGLEHLAFGIEKLEDLQTIEQTLTAAAIKHSGIHIDKHSKKEKIWLDDPDKIRLEFFLR
jgi:catechol-2,3-dioxygenase